MNETECWQLIEECTKTKDWTGVLVAADALAELGEEGTAVGLRWAVRQHVVPMMTFIDDEDRLWWAPSHWGSVGRADWFEQSLCILTLWKSILYRRQRYLEFFQ